MLMNVSTMRKNNACVCLQAGIFLFLTSMCPAGWLRPDKTDCGLTRAPKRWQVNPNTKNALPNPKHKSPWHFINWLFVRCIQAKYWEVSVVSSNLFLNDAVYEMAFVFRKLQWPFPITNCLVPVLIWIQISAKHTFFAGRILITSKTIQLGFHCIPNFKAYKFNSSLHWLFKKWSWNLKQGSKPPYIILCFV